MKAYMDKNPMTYVTEPLDLSAKNKPEYTSMKQKKRAEYVQAREKLGLLPEETGINEKKAPSLAYVENPKHKTFRDIQADRRRENMDEFRKIANKKHKTDVERLNEREEQIFANGYQESERYTKNRLKEERRQAMINYNMKTFSNKSIGVHGQELPKFADHEGMKEYWKLFPDYVENPEWNSQRKMRENHKYWKKQEDLYLDEKREFDPNQYKVKKPLLNKKSEDKLVVKVNNLNHFEGFDPDNPQPIDLENTKSQHIYRWTSLVAKFCPQKFNKGRFFDVIEEINANEGEEAAKAAAEEQIKAAIRE